MEITKQNFKGYIFGNNINNFGQELIEAISKFIGPILLKGNDFVYRSDLRYFENEIEIDWVATLNDVLLFTSEKRKENIYQKFNHLFED